MRKEKLISKRLERKISQQELAHLMHMEQSTYSRRESGDTKISTHEWKKLADLLDCKMEDIYEPDDAQIKIDNRNATFSDNSGNNNTYYNLPKSVLDNLQDFIVHLKEENQRLKKETSRLRLSADQAGSK